MGAKEPNYQSLARKLRNRILQGDFNDGRQLPTENSLADEYGLSRQTVRRAYHDLVTEGLIFRVRGRGTFAVSTAEAYGRQVSTVDDLMGLSEDTTMEIDQPLHRKIDLVSAGRLRLTSDLVYELRFVRIHEGVKFCVTTVFLPGQVARVLDDVSELKTAGAISSLTVIGLLESRLTSPIVEAQQSITVGELSSSDAQLLGRSAERHSLRIDRLYLNGEGKAVELAISHFLPEYYSYRVSLHRASDRGGRFLPVTANGGHNGWVSAGVNMSVNE